MEFSQEINQISEQTTQLCYHCHKCTAGCPVASEMEFGPDRILRMVQLGEKERLLNSSDIWLCACCETCGTRCPNEIDIARVMDALRHVAIMEKAHLGEPNAFKFHQLFMLSVEQTGRMYEAGMLGAYKVLTLNMADMDAGVKLFLAGKVPVLPDIIKNRGEVKKLFKDSQK